MFFHFKQRFPFFSPHNDQRVKWREETQDISQLCVLVSHNIQQKRDQNLNTQTVEFCGNWIKLIFVDPNKMTARWLLTALAKCFKKLAGKMAHPRFCNFFLGWRPTGVTFVQCLTCLKLNILSYEMKQILKVNIIFALEWTTWPGLPGNRTKRNAQLASSEW